MKNKFLAVSTFFMTLPIFAATPIDLATQSSNFWWKTRDKDTSQIKEMSRAVDFNQTVHMSIQQSYQNIPVFGGDGVIHSSTQTHHQTTMNGIVYDDLQKDLPLSATQVFSSVNEFKAKQSASLYFQEKFPNTTPEEISVHPLIYIDKKNQAHWAYQIRFFIEIFAQAFAPTYIVDAQNQMLYQYWNHLKTSHYQLAGGYIGNHKTGQKILDNLHLPALKVQRDAKKRICYMENDAAHLLDHRTKETMQFTCKYKSAAHQNIYWNANHDQVKTTWSPSNDVMFGIQIAHAMFKDWYHIPMFVSHKKSKKLNVVVHNTIANAYYNDEQDKFVFGDSLHGNLVNPFTQLDTVVHELAHKFTQENSNLFYLGESGGLNEAFSDIAGIMAEYYIYGKTDYLIGLGDLYAAGKALRYMDRPSRDCEGKNKPGDLCSIDHISQYDDDVEVHFSSGIFNRFFYELAHSQNWDAKKAFDLMVHANRFYWTPLINFQQAACGVMRAAADYHYDSKEVAQAFSVVGINTMYC